MRKLVRDLAIVGGVSAWMAPWAFFLYRPVTTYLVVVVVAAMATAPLVALGYLRAVKDARERPTLMLATVGALVGALWGLAVGFAGGLAQPDFMIWSVGLAGISAALQLAWLGPPLARRSLDGRRTWPFLLGATAVAPLLGNLSYGLIGLFVRWRGLL